MNMLNTERNIDSGRKKKRINPKQTIFQLHLNGIDKNKDNKK
jgi:hypothetical protein